MQFTISPVEMKTEILANVSKGLVPYFKSSPGIGKSSIVKQTMKEANLLVIDIRLPQYTPEDLQGYAMANGNKATFRPFDTFPLEGDPIPDGYDGWCILFDELSSTPKQVQAAAYKIIFDKMVGSYKLHANVAIVCAGNLATDKAVVVPMSTALQSRLIHYTLVPSVKDFNGYAHSIDLDHRIIGFLNYMPNKLMDFDPDHQDYTFACPRTWEFINLHIKGEDMSAIPPARLAGTIGTGTAVEFMTFVKEYDRIPKLDAIIADPIYTPVPVELSSKYATVSMLMTQHTENTISSIIKYVERFDIEFQIIFGRSAIIKSPHLHINNTDFQSFMQKLTKYLA